jgi:PKHD-type hydroxylase
MSYTTINNNPKDRHSITYPWVYWDNGFSDEELQKMCDYFTKQRLEKALIIDEDENDNGPKQTARKSNVNFHRRDKNTEWIYDRLNWIIQQINEQFYGFDLYGYDIMQYTEYDSVEEGKYDFHMDTIMGPNVTTDMQTMGVRKLSLTLLLNEPGVDFEGGDFQINQGIEAEAENVELKKGRIVVFPSFLLHRVSLVTSGKRKSLVIWVLGPKFK